MGHHDHHDHKHPHSHSHHHSEEAPAFPEKARKLLEHWIHHNEDHATSYRQWAEEFKKNDLSDAAGLLMAAAQATNDINRGLEEALSQLKGEK